MNTVGYQPLECYRLIQASGTIPCYICDGVNMVDSELCRHCLAPMALAGQALSQRVRPSMVATLGAAGCGKTVYLGMVADILSQPGQSMHLLARGAFSLSLQQATMASLARGQFPKKTPSEPDKWNWIHCQIQMPKRRTVELIVPDLAGDALLEEVNHPKAYPVIGAFLRKCVGAMVLIDATRLEAGDKQHDFQAQKIISYLMSLETKKNSWATRPVAITLTKADQCEKCFDDPVEFANRTAPGLMRACRDQLECFQVFATGVAGSVGFEYHRHGRVLIPLRIEPRNVVEPFDWLLDKVAK